MKKEYLVAFIGGLFLLAYVLEAVVNPLAVPIDNPYSFIQPQNLATYPFTSAIIFIRGLAIFLTPLFLLSFIRQAYLAKGVILLVLAGLMQLYAIQDIVTNSTLVTLEWALSLAYAGIALLVPTVYYLLRGTLLSMHTSMVKTVNKQVSAEAAKQAAQEHPDWLKHQQAQKKQTKS